VVVRGEREVEVPPVVGLTGGTALSLDFLLDFFSFFSFRLPLLFFSFLLSFLLAFLSITAPPSQKTKMSTKFQNTMKWFRTQQK
jgi:hypothetical protein